MQDVSRVREGAGLSAPAASPARGDARAADAGGGRFTAVVMAGSRGPDDPLAVAGGVLHKALVPVAGVPMLERVLRTLGATRSVARIVIVGIDPELAHVQPWLRAREEGALTVIRGGETPARSAQLAIDTLQLLPPILITTADHPLLRAATVDAFCAASLSDNRDVSFAVTAADVVARTFPGARRTGYPFRDTRVCGCNLYALLTAAGCTAPTHWRRVEQYRKTPWRMIGILGPRVLLRFLLGRLALDELSAVIEQRFHLRVGAIRLSDPAAGFDVDTIVQRDVAEQYLRNASTRGDA